jgi:hypothetical protein
MFTIINKILDLLSAKEKKQFYLIFASLVGMAFIEMAGIASLRIRIMLHMQVIYLANITHF